MSTAASASAPMPLAVLCDEVFFAITASRRLDPGELRALFERRSIVPPEVMAHWEPWLLGLCAAIAPIAPPHWLPMARVIDAGVSLEHGARGVRSLFTSAPSDKEIARVRSLGAFAVRALAAVLGTTLRVEREDEQLRSALISSLGLPPEDQALLRAEAPAKIDAIPLPDAVEPKIAAAIVRGSFYAAMGGGFDPREEQAVVNLAVRLNLTEKDTAMLAAEARDLIDGCQAFGDAAVDAVRYMLEGDPEAQRVLGFAALRLTLPFARRVTAAKSIAAAMPVTLGRKYTLDRPAREAVLALGWVAALRGNPTYAQRLALVTRHAQLAADLGDGSAAHAARQTVEAHLEATLCPPVSASAQ